MGNITKDIISALRKVLHREDQIGLHVPTFGGNETAYLRECIDTGWVSSNGKFVERFEKMLADYTNLPYAVAVSNGTAALHACFIVSGIKEGDEVLIPNLTFVATANAVMYARAIPHLVDICETSLGIDVAKLADYLKEVAVVSGDGCTNSKTGRRIGAVVPMHTFGHPVDMDPLVELCARYKIAIIEDAAESLGSYYKGKHTGHHSKMAALSFNGNKIITTGGGGALITHDKKLAEHARYITTTAKKPHPYRYEHTELGYNYRLPNINAALGVAQMEQLPKFLEAKRKLALRYEKVFSDVPNLKFFKEPSYAKSNYWLNTLILDDSVASQREAILKETNAIGINTRGAWELMHQTKMYESMPRMDISTSEHLYQKILNIPSSASLGEP